MKMQWNTAEYTKCSMVTLFKFGKTEICREDDKSAGRWRFFDKQQYNLQEVYSFYANLYKFQQVSEAHKLCCSIIPMDHFHKFKPKEADSLEGEI